MISDIGLWATCEASALHGSRTPARRSAAGWVLRNWRTGRTREKLGAVAYRSGHANRGRRRGVKADMVSEGVAQRDGRSAGGTSRSGPKGGRPTW